MLASASPSTEPPRSPDGSWPLGFASYFVILFEFVILVLSLLSARHTLRSCSPRSSFCSPWGRADFNITPEQTQHASPIDTVWRGSRERSSSPPRHGRAWFCPSLPMGAAGARLLSADECKQVTVGLLPPGNLLGSISSLPSIPFNSPNFTSSVSPFGTM